MGSGRSMVVVRLGPQPTRAGRAKPTTRASKGLYFTKILPQSSHWRLIRLAGWSCDAALSVFPCSIMPIIGHLGVNGQEKIIFPAARQWQVGRLAGELWS